MRINELMLPSTVNYIFVYFLSEILVQWELINEFFFFFWGGGGVGAHDN